MNQPKILYLHGLESKAKGRKCTRLSKIYETSSIQMTISKSILFYHPANLKALFIFLSAIFFLAWGFATWKWFYFVISPVLFFCFYVSYVSGYEPIIDKCVAQQVKELIRFEPDIIVGSSFGAFIALELIRRKIWKGPVLLLSSAHEIISVLTSFKMYDMGNAQFSNRVLSVVGKKDHLALIYSKRNRIQKYFRNFEVLEYDDIHSMTKTFTRSNAKFFIERVMNN